MDPIRTLDHPLTDAWGLAPAFSFGDLIPKEIKKAVTHPGDTLEKGFEFVKDIYGFAFNPVKGTKKLISRDAERQMHHEQDTAQAEAAQIKAEAEAAEQAAAKQAGQAKLAAKRRRGFSSTLFASGLGLFAPAAPAGGKELVGQ